MKPIKIGTKPVYYDGQLLLEDDFRLARNYHTQARCNHNLRFYGSGVLSGLLLERSGTHTVIVNHGVAIDQNGHDIFLDERHNIDLSKFGPNDLVSIYLGYYEDSNPEETAEAPKQSSVDCYAVVSVEKSQESNSSVLLASVQLDTKGQVAPDSISYSSTDRAHPVPPGSITYRELHNDVKSGWLSMAFKPISPNEIKDGKKILPSFDVGPTETICHSDQGGAEGSMAIPTPLGINRITHFRIAGARNDSEIKVQLFVCGWIPDKEKHLKVTLVDEVIKTFPYNKLYKIDQTEIDPEYQSLSLLISCTKGAAISLVGIKCEYE